MSVWLTIPSARPAAEAGPIIDLWRRQGYHIALWRERARADGYAVHADITRPGESDDPYSGYARAVNDLVEIVLATDKECTFCVIGGDDVEPDLAHTARQIELECLDYFAALHQSNDRTTYGVVQPTGDRWGDSRGAYIDRICGSAWLGREFCQRANQGRGPLHPEFFHMHVDECLQEYAHMLGILWQRRDLIQLHRHWGRDGDRSKMPEFLKFVNSREHWDESKALLTRLKSERFSSCLPATVVPA